MIVRRRTLKVVPPGLDGPRERGRERRGVDSLVKFLAWCVHLYTATIDAGGPLVPATTNLREAMGRSFDCGPG